MSFPPSPQITSCPRVPKSRSAPLVPVIVQAGVECVVACARVAANRASDALVVCVAVGHASTEGGESYGHVRPSRLETGHSRGDRLSLCPTRAELRAPAGLCGWFVTVP